MGYSLSVNNDYPYGDMYKKQENLNMWTTPAATELRFGFEVTMYVMNK
jgi:pyrroloquinoline quinone biosynthesis protein A